MKTGQTIRTTCAYCGVGCGVLATPKPDGSAKIEGDPDHPANFGRLCSKGLALGETLGLDQRLLHPQVMGARASWKDATEFVAQCFSDAIRNHGPDSVAFYVSGQLLTEDYYVANKLMKGFIGSANIDTNSRLCMSSAVAGHKRAFGADVVPCNYEDLEAADLVVLTGSNLAWCHPVLFQRLLAARDKRGTKLVVVDPRRTVTADEADLHLPLKPGSDVALFNGLLADLHRRGAADSRYVFKNTTGLAEAMRVASSWTIEAVAETTGLDTQQLRIFFDLFARTPRTITAFSMGVNQSSAGTDKVNAIINCHLLTGRIGKEGTGPFSITGQPNAMGGREVGGLANMLAAHMEIENEAHRKIVRDHWRSPTVATKPGLKAVELFEAVRAGRIKALWIMATNPAASLPDSSLVAEAMQKCPLVVVSDVTARTETAQYAHVLLPAAGWGEKDGTVTNSERRISRQRAFLPLPGEARPDWRIICDVAGAMGHAGFDYTSPAAIFAEHTALTTAGNGGSRVLDLDELTGLDSDAYDALVPFQWGGARPFADGKFQTPDTRARFVPTPWRPPASSTSQDHPFVLNTGRIRDQWHTMTRTGLSPRLFGQQAEPFIEIAPADASKLGIEHAGLAVIEGPHGTTIVRAMVSPRVEEGQVFQPMHWSGPFASAAMANTATRPNVDPVSGQPELKHSPVRVERFVARWHGFGVSLSVPKLTSTYWSRSPIASGHAFECAGTETPDDWLESATLMLGIDRHTGDVSFLEDHAAGAFRCAVFREDRLVAAFYVGRAPVEASRNWVTAQLGKTGINRLELLAGRPARAAADRGPTVCVCMNVGRAAIAAAAMRNSSATLNTICAETAAGTGCGSCRPEISRILQDCQSFVEAAE